MADRYSYLGCQLMGHSKQFIELVRALGDAKSKQEETAIAERELSVLKAAVRRPGISTRQLKEFAVRMLFCEMVGFPADFGYVSAINLTASGELLHHKRTGYTVVSLCVPPQSEELLLLVAAIRKDLQSTNFLETCAALGAVARVLDGELGATVMRDVQGCFKHQSPLVRKKAIVAVHALWRRCPEVVGDIDQYVRVLSDKDPSVMGCTLHFVYDLARASPQKYSNLVKPLATILRQITEHRLTREFDFERVPSPWMQIRILKTLAVLCEDSPTLSSSVHETLSEVMRRADVGTGSKIGCAVVAESVRTASVLHPTPRLIDEAAKAVAQFITSPCPDIKYYGVVALSSLVRLSPRCAAEHQSVVICCLEDADETVRRATLQLLYAMTSERNVEVVMTRLVRLLAEAQSTALEKELVSNILHLSEHHTSPIWYINTVNMVMRLGDEHISDEMVQRVLRIVAEGKEGSEMSAEVLQLKCVELYMNLQHEKYGVDRLTQVAAWVLGEYGFRWVEEGNERDQLVCRLLDLLDGACLDSTRNIVVTALAKICARQELHPDVRREIQLLASAARDVSLHQRCNELLALDQDREVLSAVLPDDGCCQDLVIDTGLSFLNGMVRQALEEGGKPYTARDLSAPPPSSPVPEESMEVVADKGIAPTSIGGDASLTWRDVNVPADPFGKAHPGGKAEAEAASRLGKAEQQFARDLFAEPSQRELERVARQKRKAERERKRLEKEQRRVAKAAVAEAKERKVAEAARRQKEAVQNDIFADIFAVPAKPQERGPVVDASVGFDFPSRQLMCCDEWASLQTTRCATPQGLCVLLVLETTALLSQVRLSLKAPSRMEMKLVPFPQNVVQAERQDSITWGPGIEDDVPAVLRVALQAGDGAFGSSLYVDCNYTIRGSSPRLLSACCHVGVADFIRCPPPARLVDFSHKALWQQFPCEVRGSAAVSSECATMADAAARCANGLVPGGQSLSIVSAGADGAELAGVVVGPDEFILARLSIGAGKAEIVVRSRHHLLSQGAAGLLTRALTSAQ